MADEPTTTANPEGVARTPEGAIADLSPSSQTTTPEMKTETKPAESGTTLLTKTEGETKVEDKTKTETKSDGAPEKYADYKVPEGFELSADLKAKVDPVFKELGLSQENAQKLVDTYSELTKEASQAPLKAWADTVKAWGEESANHPDLRGKLGPGKEINVTIGKALDSIGDATLASEFRQLMDLTGAGNHPAFIRVIHALAARVTEGTHVTGNGPSPAGQSKPGMPPPSAAAAMWPTLPSSQTRQ